MSDYEDDMLDVWVTKALYAAEREVLEAADRIAALVGTDEMLSDGLFAALPDFKGKDTETPAREFMAAVRRYRALIDAESK